MDHKTDTDSERASFEAWMCAQEGHPFVGAFANSMWKAWQARASLAASAGSEPVAWLVSGGRIFVDKPFLSQGAALRNARERDDGSAVSPLYTHPSPPEGMVGGWSPLIDAPVDEIVLVAAEFDGPGDWRIKCGYLDGQTHKWRVFGSSWEPTHWRPLSAPPIAAGGGKEADHG